MNKLLAIITVILFLVEEHRISNLQDMLDEIEKNESLMLEYRDLYWTANGKVKQADSLLNSGMIINLSSMK